jgi:hypothetical protein
MTAVALTRMTATAVALMTRKEKSHSALVIRQLLLQLRRSTDYDEFGGPYPFRRWRGGTVGPEGERRWVTWKVESSRRSENKQLASRS